MHTISKRIIRLIFLLNLFAAFNFNVLAQEEKVKSQSGDEKYKQTATELTQSLTQEVSLNAEQSQKINEALINYQKNIAVVSSGTGEEEMESKISEIDKNLKAQVNGILDEKQLTAFKDVESKWFQEVKNKTHSATVRESETKDKKY